MGTKGGWVLETAVGVDYYIQGFGYNLDIFAVYNNNGGTNDKI
jgi:hypothetical protein